MARGRKRMIGNLLQTAGRMLGGSSGRARTTRTTRTRPARTRGGTSSGAVGILRRFLR